MYAVDNQSDGVLAWDRTSVASPEPSAPSENTGGEALAVPAEAMAPPILALPNDDEVAGGGMDYEILRPSPTDDDEPAEVADCNRPLSEDPWTNMPVESAPGFDEELAALDLTVLPAQIDLAALSALARGIMAYALDMRIEGLGDVISSAELLSGGPLHRVVAGSLLRGMGATQDIDFAFLRRGLHRYYHCGRDFPLTLDGFERTIFDYDDVQAVELDSIAECDVRRIVGSDERGAYIAETVIDGPVRETEVLLSGRRNDGNLDFLVYDENGRLSDRTQFPTVSMDRVVMTAAPYVCTTCHFQQDSTHGFERFDLLFPDAGPCSDR